MDVGPGGRERVLQVKLGLEGQENGSRLKGEMKKLGLEIETL